MTKQGISRTERTDFDIFQSIIILQIFFKKRNYGLGHFGITV